MITKPTKLKTTYKHNKMKQILLLTFAIFLFACENPSPKYSSVFELRQLVKSTEKGVSSSATFFLIAGSYSSSDYSRTTVKVFAKVDGAYRFIEIPMSKIRIIIDNNIKVPTLQLQLNAMHGFTDEEFLNNYGWLSSYIIRCPEQYLPEKLLPIEL